MPHNPLPRQLSTQTVQAALQNARWCRQHVITRPTSAVPPDTERVQSPWTSSSGNPGAGQVTPPSPLKPCQLPDSSARHSLDVPHWGHQQRIQNTGVFTPKSADQESSTSTRPPSSSQSSWEDSVHHKWHDAGEMQLQPPWAFLSDIQVREVAETALQGAVAPQLIERLNRQELISLIVAQAGHGESQRMGVGGCFSALEPEDSVGSSWTLRELQQKERPRPVIPQQTRHDSMHRELSPSLSTAREGWPLSPGCGRHTATRALTPRRRSAAGAKSPRRQACLFDD